MLGHDSISGSPVSFYKVMIGLNLNKCFFGQYSDYHLVTQIKNLFLISILVLKIMPWVFLYPVDQKTNPPMQSCLTIKISHWKLPKILARYWDFLPFNNLVKCFCSCRYCWLFNTAIVWELCPSKDQPNTTSKCQWNASQAPHSSPKQYSNPRLLI